MTITNSAGSCSDRSAFSPGGSSTTSRVTSSSDLLEIVRDIEAGAPEDLPEIFCEREIVRIVRRDPADPAAHRECHLDHLVECRLDSRRRRSRSRTRLC